MSGVGDAFDEVRAALADEAADILPDLADFSYPGAETRDSRGEVSTPNSSLPNIPCSIEPIRPYERLAAGEVAAFATNTMKLPATSAALLIDGTYSGTIHARGSAPAREFNVKANITASSDSWCFLVVEVKS